MYKRVPFNNITNNELHVLRKLLNFILKYVNIIFLIDFLTKSILVKIHFLKSPTVYNKTTILGSGKVVKRFIKNDIDSFNDANITIAWSN